jgi:hypothetical protein
VDSLRVLEEAGRWGREMNAKGHLVLGPAEKDVFVHRDLEGRPTKVGIGLPASAGLRGTGEAQRHRQSDSRNGNGSSE